MAGEQRKLAHASKRDSGAQKTIAVLGTVFLPGAFLSSVFSMTFFDFQDLNPDGTWVSPQFWIYWAVAVPLTVLIVGWWWIWERRRERKYEEEDSLLEQGVETMELSIQREMRQRTMSKVATWDNNTAKKLEV